MNNTQNDRPKTIIYSTISCLILLLAMSVNASSQNFHWAKPFGGPNWDKGTAIATDANGNVYIAGNFPDTIDFDPGPGTYNLIAGGQQDVFVSKLDASGHVIWAKNIGGAGWEECNDIAVDKNGNVYITGNFLGISDFDPGPGTFSITSSASTNAFICKLNASGNFVWAKKFGEVTSGSMPAPVSSNSIAVDASGNVYTTGSFDGPADFDPGPAVVSLTPGGVFSTDIFVSKLDAAGNFVWVKQLGGMAFEAGYGIALDASGNIFTTGFFNGTVDFDPGLGTFSLTAPPPASGSTEIYVSKLDASGNFVWAKQLTGKTGYALATDNGGNVYVSGDYLNDSVTISKFDASGNGLWAKQIGADIAWSLAVDGGSGVYITGQFHGTADFDPGPGTSNLVATANGASYICKLDSAGNLAWAKQLSGTYQVWNQALAVDSAANVFTTGYFGGTTDFDPGSAVYNLTAIGSSYDVFVHKLGSDNLGVAQPSPKDMFKIYPNPTTGRFTIEFEDGGRGSDIVIRNVMGQVVETKLLNGTNHMELEINKPAGIYFLELHERDGRKAVTRIKKD